MVYRFIFVIILLAVGPGLAAQEGYVLHGRVLDHGGLPLPGAEVLLHGPVEKTAVSDSLGFFLVRGLPDGEYSAEVHYLSYQSWQGRLDPSEQTGVMEIKLQPKPELLQEVVIKTDEVEQRKKEQSLNLEIVEGEYLRMNLSGSLMQSLDRLPGVNSISLGSGQSKPMIRGLSFNRLVVAENGIRRQGQQWGVDHGLEMDQFAAEEVEVLKGPATLLYGPDAIGGVIDIRNTSLPGVGEYGGSIDLAGRSNNMQGTVSAGLFGRSESFYFKSRLTLSDYADYQVPADSIQYYSYYFRLKDRKLRNTAGTEQNVHLTTGWLGERWNTHLDVSNLHSRSGFFANAHGLEIRTSDIDYDRTARDIDLPYQSVNHLSLLSRSTYLAGRHTLGLKLGWQHNLRCEFSEPAEHGYMPMPPDSLEREFGKQTWTAKLSWELPQMGKHHLQAGLDGEWQHNRIGGWGFIIPAFDASTAGLYALDKYRISQAWLLQAGLRYDAGQVATESYTDWYATPMDGGQVSLYQSRAPSVVKTMGSMSWSAGAVYTQGGWIAKLNLGKSFRMPIAKELAANGLNYHIYRYERGKAGLKPEQSYQADASSEWKNERLALQISPFVNFFPSYIYLNPTAEYHEGLQVYDYVQNEVFRYGGELHAHYKITKQWKTGLIGEYLKARQLSGQKEGFGLPFTPPPSLLLNLKYEHPSHKRLKTPYISVDYKLAAAQEDIVPPEKKTPGYQLLNLSIGAGFMLAGNELCAHLQVRNLLGRRYLNHTSYYRLIEVPEPGRSFILSLHYEF